MSSERFLPILVASLFALIGEGANGIYGWGTNSPAGRLTTPASIGNVIDIDCGCDHTVALRSDGTVVAWGASASAQVPAGLKDVVDVDAGWGWTLALKKDGSLEGWGHNDCGQVSATPSGAGYLACSAGNMHGAAIRSNNTVVCWGRNDMGQSAVPSGLSNVVSVVAAGHNTAALRSDGTVVVWGDPKYGQTAVPSGATNICAIAAGDNFVVALKKDGTVVAWGDNTDGKITVPGGLSGVNRIFANGVTTYAIKDDGSVVAWGDRDSGQKDIPLLPVGQAWTSIGPGWWHVYGIAQMLTPIYVATNGNDVSGQGTSNSPFATIQKGVDSATNRDVVVVRAGVYSGSGNRAVNLRGKSITVTSLSGPDDTILDLGRNQAFLAHSTETLGTVINGFTITNGYVQSGQDWGGDGIVSIVGGALLTIKNCIFTKNETKATYVTTTTGIVVKKDAASAAAIIDNCLFYGNKIGGGGWTSVGGGTAMVIAGCGGGGAGLIANVRNSTIANNTLYSSVSDWWGDFGGGIRIALSGNILVNNIVWGNSATHFPPSYAGVYQSGGQTFSVGSTPVAYSISQNGAITNATSTVSATDPLFVASADGDFSLSLGSPGINSGDPATPLDTDGTRADMGYRADRFVPPVGIESPGPTLCTVTFNPGEGTVVPTTMTVTNGAAYGTLPVPVRTGYAFGGWWTNEGGTGTQVVDTSIVTAASDHTLNAKWVENVASLMVGLVAYYPFNGNANDLSGNGNHGNVFGAMLTADRFGRTNSAFYFNGTNAYIQVNDAPSLRPCSSVSISAWVRIDAVSANYTRIVTKGKNLGAAYSNYQLTTGTRPGFDDLSEKPLFTLWPTEKYDFPRPAHSLGYGAWHHLCGTWDGETAKLYYNGFKEAEVAIGGVMEYDSNPLVIGKDLFYNNCFKGAIDDIRIYSRALSASEVESIYSGAEQVYMVSFDPQDGVFNPTNKMVTFGALYGTLPSPIRAGYTFTGWTATTNSTVFVITSNSVVTIASDHTLTARWTANSYAVTFDSQGGTVNPANKAVTFDAVYGELPVPTMTGYTFGGWWTGSGGAGARLTEATVVATAADHTLFAKWTANTYTVTFDPAGGSVSPTNVPVTYDAPYGALPVPTRAGYAFAGWWTGVSGAGTEVTSLSAVTTAADHKLYAKWTANETLDWTATVGVAFSVTLSDAFEGVDAKAKGLPPGLKYNGAARRIEGVPAKVGAFMVTVSAADVGERVFVITVQALPVWASGAFNGYVEGSGPATMTVSKQGKVSGKMAVAGTNYIFSVASFAAGGDPTNGISFATVAKAGKNVLPLELTISPSAPQPLGVAAGLCGDALPVIMFRDVWKTEASTLAPYIGYYTAALPPDSAECGSGYLTLTVDPAGKVKAGGKMADGTSVSLNATLILDGEGRVFAVVYAAPGAYKGGYVFGLAEFAVPDEGDAFLRPLGALPFAWVNRNPQATGEYGSGFNRDLGLTGGRYDKLINLRSFYANGLTVGDVDLPGLTATVKYTDWGDDDGKVSWTEPVLVDANGGASPAGLVLSPNAAGTGFASPQADTPVQDPETGEYDYASDTTGDGVANTSGLSFTFVRGTGLLKGSFKLWYDFISAADATTETYKSTHKSKTASFQGVLIPSREDTTDGVEGKGFFLWPEKGVIPATAAPYAFSWSYDFLLLSTPAP